MRTEPAGGSNFWSHSDGPTTIHAGQTSKIPYSLSMASNEPIMKVSWREGDGSEHDKDFHIG